MIIIISIQLQVGTEGTPKNPLDESKTAVLAHPFKVLLFLLLIIIHIIIYLQGVHYEYRNDAAPILGAASNEQVLSS